MNDLARRLLGPAHRGHGALQPLPLATECLAIAIDTMVESVHFDARTGPEDLGYKALAVNLSDLAAMGAEPLGGALILAATRERLDGDWLELFAAGLLGLADRFGVRWRGTVTCEGPLSATVEVTGALGPAGGLRRDGARPGDDIYVTGSLGDAGGALQADRVRVEAPDRRYLDERLKRPTPRVALGLAARGLASSAIDLSDGLSSDLVHVLRASGASAVVETDRVPVSRPLARAFGRERALAIAVSAGDDYELALTVPAARATTLCEHARRLACPLTRIGTVTAPAAHPGDEAGTVRWRDAHRGSWEPPRGFGHFA